MGREQHRQFHLSTEMSGYLPRLFLEDDILVPLHLDVTLSGTHYTDSLLFPLFDASEPIFDFAASLCVEKDLPSAFAIRIAMQMSEQLEAYADIVTTLLSKEVRDFHSSNTEPTIPALQYFKLSVIYKAIEYKDEFEFDIIRSAVTTEEIAMTTCNDLGLPTEIGKLISFQLRETIMRLTIDWYQSSPNEREIILRKYNANGNSKWNKVSVTVMEGKKVFDVVKSVTNKQKPADTQTTVQSTVFVNHSGEELWKQGTEK